MLVKHEFEIHSKCPVDGLPDAYNAVVETTKVLFVEELISEILKYRDIQISQEALTEELARKLGVKVTTSGRHSGVKTTVICG